MNRKRIIATILTDGVKVYNSYNYEYFRIIGDLDIFLVKLQDYKIDEIMILDISTRLGKDFETENFMNVIRSCNLNTPLSFGGNIFDTSYVRKFIYTGIERVIIGINTLQNTDLLDGIANLFGFSSVIIHLPIIDINQHNGNIVLKLKGKNIDLQIEQLGIPRNFNGEICILDTSCQGTNKLHNIDHVKWLSCFFKNANFILSGGFAFNIPNKFMNYKYVSGIVIDNGLSFKESARQGYVNNINSFRSV
jgi:imidazole glycerol phosphate synthase subunit HisF